MPYPYWGTFTVRDQLCEDPLFLRDAERARVLKSRLSPRLRAPQVRALGYRARRAAVGQRAGGR